MHVFLKVYLRPAPVCNHGLSKSGMRLLVYFHLKWLKHMCSGIAQCEQKNHPRVELNSKASAPNKPCNKLALKACLRNISDPTFPYFSTAEEGICMAHAG